MDQNIRPITKSTLADDLAQRVTQLIQGGSYQLGDRLPTINEMARRFEVGHPTLREALKKLEALGFVEIKHGSGVFVKNLHGLLLVSNPVFEERVSKKMMLDLIGARIPIECNSARLAAENATSTQLERMGKFLAKAEDILSNGKKQADYEALTAHNMAFHREIASASDNAVLAQISEVLSKLFRHEQRIILNIHGSPERDHSEHMSILKALRTKDGSLVEKRMRDHLEGVRAVLLQWDPDEHPVT